METHSSILAWKNSMDRGVWRATDHGAANSRIQVSEWAHIQSTLGLSMTKAGLDSLSLTPKTFLQLGENGGVRLGYWIWMRRGRRYYWKWGSGDWVDTPTSRCREQRGTCLTACGGKASSWLLIQHLPKEHSALGGTWQEEVLWGKVCWEALRESTWECKSTWGHSLLGLNLFHCIWNEGCRQTTPSTDPCPRQWDVNMVGSACPPRHGEGNRKQMQQEVIVLHFLHPGTEMPMLRPGPAKATRSQGDSLTSQLRRNKTLQRLKQVESHFSQTL